MESIPLTTLRVYGAKSAESPSTRVLLAGRDGQLQGDER